MQLVSVLSNSESIQTLVFRHQHLEHGWLLYLKATNAKTAPLSIMSYSIKSQSFLKPQPIQSHSTQDKMPNTKTGIKEFYQVDFTDSSVRLGLLWKEHVLRTANSYFPFSSCTICN